MDIRLDSVLNLFKPSRIAIPIIIGLSAALFLVYQTFDLEAYQKINWHYGMALWLFLSVMMMVVRDLAYMYRIRVLTEKKISWRNSFDVIMLWEFASSVTPSIVGGTAAAFFILTKEKIKAGKTTAIVLTTAFLDELFFITAAPLLFLLVGFDNILPGLDTDMEATFFYGRSIFVIFLIGYGILFVYTLFLAYGLFWNPRGLKWLIVRFTSIKWLRKWRDDAIKIGNDVIVTSNELAQKNWGFWLKAFGATVASWSSRFIMVNLLIMAFINVDEHFYIYARQVIMWIILLITPTPGGSGMAEFIFPAFFSTFLPVGIAASVAFLWRTLSYYPYLFIGAIVLPNWIKRVFHAEQKLGAKTKKRENINPSKPNSNQK